MPENVARVAHEKQGACCVPETQPAKTSAKTTACC